MVRYILSSVGGRVKLDRRCRHCGRGNGRIHSGLRYRGIRDVRVLSVPQRRMRCPDCGLTWTLRGEGVGPGRQRSDQLRLAGVVLYMFGLSYRSVERFLPLLGCPTGKSSIERDVGQAGQGAKGYHESAPRVRVRILGVDGTGAAMAGVNAGVLFFVDVELGKLVCVEPVQERDAAKLRGHVARVMAEVGAEELRTDEYSGYQGMVAEARHRICLAHWRKSKGKRAYDLYRQALAEERPLEAQSMRRLLELLRQRPRPPTVPEELTRLVGRYICCRRGLLW